MPNKNEPNEQDREGFADSEQVTPDRLVAVAVAVYDACTDWAREHGGKAIYPTDLLGSPEQPKSMTEFTRFEVEEAAAFLVRMGFIQPKRSTTGH